MKLIRSGRIFPWDPKEMLYHWLLLTFWKAHFQCNNQQPTPIWGVDLPNHLRGYHRHHTRLKTTRPNVPLGVGRSRRNTKHVEIFQVDLCPWSKEKISPRLYLPLVYVAWLTWRVCDWLLFFWGVVGALVHSSYPIPSWDWFVYLHLVDFYGIKAKHNIHGLMVWSHPVRTGLDLGVRPFCGHANGSLGYCLVYWILVSCLIHVSILASSGICIVPDDVGSLNRYL